MAYINIQKVSLAFGTMRLFDGISLTIEQGERVALVGRNGSGKSTLLKLIKGSIKPDSGSVTLQKGMRCAYLSQTVPQDVSGTVFDIVSTGLNPQKSEADKTLPAKKAISLMELNAQSLFSSLSAGIKRQVLLAKALAGEPDILLLDEPTNHMYIDAIDRLEEMSLKFTGTMIFVTHDRMFLQRIATRIVEIDRGKLFDQSCDYETFLNRRAAALDNEQTLNEEFDKNLEKEEKWARQGVRARRARNEGRRRELERLREIRQARRKRTGKVKMAVQKTERSGTLVVKAKDVNFSYGRTPVIANFSTMIIKGDRVGIIGPNGCGKTTLLRILLGELPTNSGIIRLGTNLQISYFDQLREQLDENKTVMENVVEGKETVTVNGRTRNIIGYLQDFLFEPEQIRSYVSLLSGGECNRLLLARLFTQPSNVLVLDEPTNDLDIETLDILEEILMNYNGTVILVSHDRTFLNNVVTSTLVFEGNAEFNEYIGGYDDWVRQRQTQPLESNTPVKQKEIPAKTPRRKTKFGFKQQKELEILPQTIQSLENEQKELLLAIADPELYKKGKTEVITKNARLESIKKELADVYVRWEELEQLKMDTAK